MSARARRSSNSWKRRMPALAGPLVVIVFHSCLSTVPALHPPLSWPDPGVSGTENDVVFRQGQVLNYLVAIDPKDLEYIEAHGLLEEWRPARLRVTGGPSLDIDLGEIDFRHKGAGSTLFYCWGEAPGRDGDPCVTTREESLGLVRRYDGRCVKIPYKIRFRGERGFFGLRTLNLHSETCDPTRLREMLAYGLFRDFGVDAPRTAPARLYINGADMGLFIAVEDIDARYVKDHYPGTPPGNLYKEIWPSALQAKAGPGQAAYILDGLRSSPHNPPVVTDFKDFSNAVWASSRETFTGDMASRVDLDHLLRYLAVDRAVKNWDGVMAFYTSSDPADPVTACHNYFWYRGAGEGAKFILIPWDLDNTLPDFDPYADPHGLGASQPVPDWRFEPKGGLVKISAWWESTWLAPTGCDKFLNLLAANQWRRFVTMGRTLLSGPLLYEKMKAKIDAWAWLIAPVLKEDFSINYDQWLKDYQHFRDFTLKKTITDFSAYLESEKIK